MPHYHQGLCGMSREMSQTAKFDGRSPLGWFHHEHSIGLGGRSGKEIAKIWRVFKIFKSKTLKIPLSHSSGEGYGCV